MTLEAGERTRRPDGGLYEPLVLRVVASIFPKHGEAKRGRTLDGWQLELFATDLPADGWPALELVAAYFGRTGQENRFAQEDRELGLDRIVSYELPGQELASLVGLALWNLRLVRGFELEPPPATAPPARVRHTELDERVPERWPRDPVVCKELAQQDWPELLAKRPGWSHAPATGELRCSQDRPLALTSVRPAEHAPGRTGVIFRRPSGGCVDCPSRPECLRTERREATKHVEVTLPSEPAGRLRDRLAVVRSRPSSAIVPIEVQPGPRALEDALLLPALARQLFAELFVGATLHLSVELPPPEPARPRLVALDPAARQHRRKTWQQNLDRYALPDNARVRLVVAASPKLRHLLGEPSPQRAAACAAS